jgi:hypothetical protein
MALEAEREGKSLFTHSRRTATPPLNSSVEAVEKALFANEWMVKSATAKYR